MLTYTKKDLTLYIRTAFLMTSKIKCIVCWVLRKRDTRSGKMGSLFSSPKTQTVAEPSVEETEAEAEETTRKKRKKELSEYTSTLLSDKDKNTILGG